MDYFCYNFGMKNFDLLATKYVFEHSRKQEKLWRLITLRGMFVFVVAYACLLIFDDFDFQKLLPVISLLITFLATMLIRYTVRRPRPSFPNANYTAWLNSFSFPSLHSSLSFAFSVSLSLAFWSAWPTWRTVCLIIFFNTLAAIIAYSRLSVGVHYFSDILAGSLLGIIVSAMV